VETAINVGNGFVGPSANTNTTLRSTTRRARETLGLGLGITWLPYPLRVQISLSRIISPNPEQNFRVINETPHVLTRNAQLDNVVTMGTAIRLAHRQFVSVISSGMFMHPAQTDNTFASHSLAPSPSWRY
jgi:hypothetical protein